MEHLTLVLLGIPRNDCLIRITIKYKQVFVYIRKGNR